MGIENKQKKNKIDIHSSEHKEKLRQRFLERQKLTQSIDDKPSKEIKTKKNNKYYEGSSDEEDEVQEKPTEIANKTSTEVLKTFKSFSNIWQDSDDEKDDDDEHDSDSSSDSSS